MRLLWSQPAPSPLQGLSLARERGWALAWDAGHVLYLVNHTGERQAQRPAPAAVAAACCADDGSTFAAAGAGQLWLLAPDLTPRRTCPLSGQPVAVALDALGQHVAVADAEGGLSVFDLQGRPVWRVTTPRPLRWLAFVPEKPFLVGSADFGLVACFDAQGKCVWRDGLVAHVGSLAVSGDGGTVALACYSEGLCCYSVEGPKSWRVGRVAPCRLVALSYTGDLVLTADLATRLSLRRPDGEALADLDVGGMSAGLALGPLGDYAVAALADGRLLGLDMNR